MPTIIGIRVIWQAPSKQLQARDPRGIFGFFQLMRVVRLGFVTMLYMAHRGRG